MKDKWEERKRRDEYNHERDRQALWNSRRNIIKPEQTVEYQKLKAKQAEIDNRLQEVLGRMEKLKLDVATIIKEQESVRKEQEQLAIELAKGQSQQSQADIVRAALAKEQEDDELDR